MLNLKNIGVMYIEKQNEIYFELHFSKALNLNHD